MISKSSYLAIETQKRNKVLNKCLTCLFFKRFKKQFSLPETNHRRYAVITNITNSGEEVTEECGDGLVFNPETLVCDCSEFVEGCGVANGSQDGGENKN